MALNKKRKGTSFEEEPVSKQRMALRLHEVEESSDAADLMRAVSLNLAPSSLFTITSPFDGLFLENGEMDDIINITPSEYPNQGSFAPPRTSLQITPEQDTVEVVPIDGLFKPARQKSCSVKIIGKAIVIKPLNLAIQNPPIRLSFIPGNKSNLIQNGDRVKISMTTSTSTDHTKNMAIQWDNTPVDKDGLCHCFERHNKSTFCVKIRDVDGYWDIVDNNPTFSFTVKDVQMLNVHFASLVLQSSLRKPFSSLDYVQQLVFRVEKASWYPPTIYEERFYMKSAAVPKRDIDAFIKTLHKKNLVPKREAQDKKKEPICLLKIALDGQYEEELLDIVRGYGGKCFPYSLQ